MAVKYSELKNYVNLSVTKTHLIEYLKVHL